jgi:hypothetical protein
MIKESDIFSYVSVFDRQKIEEYYHAPIRHSIILPIELYVLVSNMIERAQETRGVMLYEKSIVNSKDFYIVRCVIEIGIGDYTSVYPDQSKMIAINDIIRSHNMQWIDFHTHTLSTGQHWSNQFSTGDYKSISAIMNRMTNWKKYMHVLFTPTSILTFGIDKPELVLPMSENENVLPTHNKWLQLFNSTLNSKR